MKQAGFMEYMKENEREIKVSVVVPVFNSEEFLTRSIGSILEQSLEEIEVICIDDASKDDSLIILEEFQKLDNRMIIVRHQENKGAAISRNEGLERARGKYIIFLDSDDYFFENMLESVYNKAEENQADVVIFGAEQIIVTDEKWKRIYPMPQKKEDLCQIVDTLEEKTNFLYGVRHVPWDKMVRKDLLIKSDIRFQNGPTNNDIYYSFSVVSCAKNIVLCNQILMRYYCGRIGSLTERRSTGQNHMVEAMNQVFMYMKYRDVDKQIQVAFLNIFLDNLQMLLSDSGKAMDFRVCIREKAMKCSECLEAWTDCAERGLLHPHNYVFLKKLLSGEDIYNVEYMQYYVEALKDIIISKRESGIRIAVWGCGERGRQLLDLLDEIAIQVDYVIDEKKSKVKESYNEYPIYSYEQIRDNVETIFITNLEYKIEIQQQAFDKEVIYVWK